MRITSSGSVANESAYRGYVGVRPAFYLNVENFTKNYSEYSLKIIDSFTNRPIQGCTVTMNENEIYTSDEDGLVTVYVENISDYAGKEIMIFSSGYEDSSCYITDWSLYSQNIIQLDSSEELGGKLFDLSNLVFSEETINGPTINFLGQDITLFTLDVGIDFSEISGLESLKHLEKANNILIDESSKTIKIMLGVADGYQASSDEEWHKDFQSFKDYYKTFNKNASYSELKNKYDKINNHVKKIDTDLVFSCTGSACGYVEIDYSSGSPVFREGGIVLTTEAGVSHEFPMGTFFYATLELKGEVEGTLVFERNDMGAISLGMDTVLSFQPSMGVGAKALSKKIASAELRVEGEIKAELSVPARQLAEALRLSFNADVCLRMNLLMLQAKFNKEFINVELYPNWGATDAAMLLSLDDDSFDVISRDYATGNRAMLMSLTSNLLNEQDVYPYSSPKLAKLDDGKIVAFWIKDDGTKSDNNRTTLYYSVYADECWTTPMAVCESGRVDFAPQICVEENNVHIVWQRATKIFGDSYDLTEALQNTELVYSKFEDNKFSKPVVVTENADMYQVTYSIAAEDDAMLISWVENSENDYTLSTGETKIYSRILEGEIWNTIEIVNSDVGEVSSIASGFVNGTPKVAYSIINSNSDDATYELYIGNEQVTSDNLDDVAVSYQNGAFYWLKDDNIYRYEKGETIDVGVVCSDSNFVILSENDIEGVVCRVDDGFTNELFVSYKIDETYTTPVVLSNYGKHISQYDAILHDGNVLIFADVDNLNDISGGFPYTTTDLVCEIQEGRTDISIADYVMYDDVIEVGSNTAFTTEVQNQGTTSIEGYKLTITDSNGKILSRQEYDSTVKPGETENISIEYMVPEAFSQTELIFTVSVDGESDISNNTVSIIFGKADIEITDCFIEDGYIQGEIINNGFACAEDVTIKIKYLNDEQILLPNISVATLEAGESSIFKYELPSAYRQYTKYYESNKFVIEASSSNEESNYANNSCDVLGMPKHVNGITLNATQLQICVGQTVGLKASIQPLDAMNPKVVWISDSVDVATVEQNGTICANSAGTAIITAITEDGDFVASCTVTVVMQDLKFAGANLSLQNNLAIKYRVAKSLIDDNGYENPYVIFNLNSNATKVTTYTEDEECYLFEFKNIAPNQMNDTIYATLYAEFNGNEYASATVEYSVAQYCYNMLSKCSDESYAELRTLLVDLLNYGAEAQIYTDYNTENLVNANLTEEQAGWGTSEEAELETVLDTKYTEIENPAVAWKSAVLNLNDSITIQVKLETENVSELQVKIIDKDGKVLATFAESQMEATDGGYNINFKGLHAGQMSEEIYITAYRAGVPVSNTVRYSIESYAYAKQDSEYLNLSALVKAMMKYGNSAYAYINQ